MSAIVAKAINDSLGTDKFEGLNTILKNALSNFNEETSEILNNFASQLEESIRSGISTGLVADTENIYWNFTPDFCNRTFVPGRYLSRTIKFYTNGSICVKCDSTYGRSEVQPFFEIDGKTYNGGNVTIPIHYGDVLTAGIKVVKDGASVGPTENFCIYAKTIDTSCIDVM